MGTEGTEDQLMGRRKLTKLEVLVMIGQLEFPFTVPEGGLTEPPEGVSVYTPGGSEAADHG